jgi:hypothetical protein
MNAPHFICGMKKFFLLSFIAVTSTIVISQPNSNRFNNPEQVIDVNCTYGQCSAIAKSTGVQCRNCCQQGSNVCWSHRN